MAKLVGLIGTGSGRVGNMVLAKRDGLTIARAYQPQVANPSTEGQVNQRAKFALLTKLAATLGQVIYPLAAKGNTRGQFVAIHMDKVDIDNTATPNNAAIDEGDIDLTGSITPIGGEIVAYREGNVVQLQGNVSSSYGGGSAVCVEVATPNTGLQVYSVSRVPINTSSNPTVSVEGNIANVGGAQTKYLVFLEAPVSDAYQAKYQRALAGNALDTIQNFERIAKASGLKFSRTALVEQVS